MTPRRYELVYSVDPYEEDEQEYLTFRQLLDKSEEATCRPANNATPDEIAAFLDMCLESANYHDFVGVNDILVGILREHTDEETTRKIMVEIAERGGIEELV
jgi:hypothetical protein